MATKPYQVTFITDPEIYEWVRWARENGYNTSVIFRKLLHDYIDAQKRLGGGQYATMAFEVTTNDTK